MSAVTIDPLIRLRPSAELTQFIQYLHNDHPDLAMAESLAGKDLLTVQDIRWVYDQRHLLKDRDDSGVHFHDLMSDCQMVLPEPKFPPRNPELEARIQKLKAEQAERDYKKMTQNVDGQQGLARDSAAAGLDQPIGKQMRELNNYLLLILQFLITVGCSFAFGYMAPYFLRGVTSVATRLLCGILLAFVVAFADLYFVLKFLLEIEGVIKPDKTKVYDAKAPAKKIKSS